MSALKRLRDTVYAWLRWLWRGRAKVDFGAWEADFRAWEAECPPSAEVRDLLRQLRSVKR